MAAVSLVIRASEPSPPGLIGINIESKETVQTKTACKLLKELCITYDLHNLVTESTCFTHTHESAIYVILRNSKYNFMHSNGSETGLSDFHKMVCTFMRNTYSRQEPVKITYRDYKGFDQIKLPKRQKEIKVSKSY